MKVLLFLAFFFLSACTHEGEATRVLEMDGVTNIEMTGYKFWGCGKDDFYHTGFKGQRNGKEISGVVCSGLIFKSSTIRY